MVELGSCFLMMAPIAHQQLWRCKGLPVSLHWVFHNNMNNWAWLKTIKLWFRTWKKHCLFVYICGFVHVWVPYNLDYRLEIKHGRRENASYYIYVCVYKMILPCECPSMRDFPLPCLITRGFQGALSSTQTFCTLPFGCRLACEGPFCASCAYLCCIAWVQFVQIAGAYRSIP